MVNTPRRDLSQKKNSNAITKVTINISNNFNNFLKGGEVSQTKTRVQQLEVSGHPP